MISKKKEKPNRLLLFTFFYSPLHECQLGIKSFSDADATIFSQTWHCITNNDPFFVIKVILMFLCFMMIIFY